MDEKLLDKMRIRDIEMHYNEKYRYACKSNSKFIKTDKNNHQIPLNK